MEQVSYKSPMPLQTQIVYTCFAYAVVFFPGVNAVTALWLKYLLITRVGKFPGHFHFPLASEGAFFLHIPW